MEQAIKAARDAMLSKSYNEALMECNFILNNDKSHIEALIIVSVIYDLYSQFDRAMEYSNRVDLKNIDNLKLFNFYLMSTIVDD